MIAVLRFPLLPFAIVLELALLALGWILTFARPVTAARLAEWVEQRFPSLDWYLGRTRVSVANAPTIQALKQVSKMDSVSDAKGYIRRPLRALEGSCRQSIERGKG